MPPKEREHLLLDDMCQPFYFFINIYILLKKTELSLVQIDYNKKIHDKNTKKSL